MRLVVINLNFESTATNLRKTAPTKIETKTVRTFFFTGKRFFQNSNYITRTHNKSRKMRVTHHAFFFAITKVCTINCTKRSQTHRLKFFCSQTQTIYLCFFNYSRTQKAYFYFFSQTHRLKKYIFVFFKI